MRSALTPTPVRSPCVKVCELDQANGLCRGCLRTQDERDWWVAYSAEQQREVLLRCEQRRATMAAGSGDLSPNMGVVDQRRRKAPEACSSLSTSVVLPWSTWAMMAMLRNCMGCSGRALVHAKAAAARDVAGARRPD